MKRQDFFIQLSVKIGCCFFLFFLYFLKKRLIHFLCSLLLLFVPVGKRLNSRSQFFYEIDALKNLAIFTGKKLQETPTQVFSCEYCEMFKYSFLYRTPVHYTFPKFYVMIEFFESPNLGTKLIFSYFLCHCFVFLHNSRVRIGSSFLFRVSVTFTRIRTTAPSLS